MFNLISKCGGNNNDDSIFECNICLELAQDPIVTLCGHLFCWPCLYLWLHVHSQSQECPVCNAAILEEKLVPLYGRGKSSKRPDVNVPNRPAGQRPPTAPPACTNYFGLASGFRTGDGSMTAPRFGNFTFSDAFGHVIPSMNWESDNAIYQTLSSFLNEYSNIYFKMMFLLVGVIAIIALTWNHGPV